jgi:hypothetical protein
LNFIVEATGFELPFNKRSFDGTIVASGSELTERKPIVLKLMSEIKVPSNAISEFHDTTTLANA